MRRAMIEGAALVEVVRQRRAEDEHKRRLLLPFGREEALRKAGRVRLVFAMIGVAILSAALLLRGVL